MLRLVVGPTVEKRVIYRAVSVLDRDGDRNISLEELSLFVYKVWRSQLDSLADELAVMTSGDAKKADKVLKERDDIKDAIKKNFSRAWRDRVEREREGHTVSGPFASILKHMGVGRTDRQLPSTHDCSGRSDYDNHQQSQSTRTQGQSQGQGQVQGPGVSQGSSESYSPNSSQSSWSQSNRTASRPLSTSTSHASSTGHNGLLRFKIKVSPDSGGLRGGGAVPNRKGVTLSMPKVRNLNEDLDLSSDVAPSLFKTYY
jgi:hypothetical protein